MTDALRQAILERDWNATLLARKSGEGVGKQIVDLTTHENREVRMLALACMEEAGGTDARAALAEGLLDSDVQVRSTAVRGLHKHPDPVLYPRLMQVFDRSTRLYVRRQIPMIVARNDQGITEQAPLWERWREEQDPKVEEGFIVGLARLGDPEARKAFVQRLHSSSGRPRDQWLGHCEFVRETWLLEPLGPVLLDETKLRYLGPHGQDVDLRACDIAVNLVADIAGKRFSFLVSSRSNYTPEQRAEVKKFVEGLP